MMMEGGKMKFEEVKLEELHTEEFINRKTEEISSMVGDGLAVNALSGGVDSSVVTMLAHRALGDRLKSYFIDSGLMRAGEPEHIVGLFKKLGVRVENIDAKKQFFGALKGKTDPEEKREAITQTFYPIVFARLAKKAVQPMSFRVPIIRISKKRWPGLKDSIILLNSWELIPKKHTDIRSSNH